MPPARTAWLISALYPATAVGQPVVERLVDLYGPRRLFLAGTALTGIAGVLGAFAPNLGVLIASSANGAFFPATADAAGLHDLALFDLVISGALLVVTVLGRSIARIGKAVTGETPRNS